MIRLLAILVVVLSCVGVTAQHRNVIEGGVLAELLRDPLLLEDDRFGAVLRDPYRHRLQFALAEVLDDDGNPTLRRSAIGLGSSYFYPASTVKLFAAASSLEHLRAFDGIGPEVPMTIWPLDGESVEPVSLDESNANGGVITPAHEIRKLFVISDNRAFNRLYDLVGHERLNLSAREAGLGGVVINHRLAVARSREQNLSAPRVMLQPDGPDPVDIKPRRSMLELDNAEVPRLEVGVAELVAGERLERPKSFLRSNRAELLDLQNALISIVHPEIETGVRGYAIAESDRELLASAMTWLPRESPNPVYDRATYPDDWVKFMLEGVRRVIPAESVRYTNKIGLAYGFTTENAYVEDLRTGRSFFFAGTMYTNRNETLNDNIYEYDEQAMPLWRAIGESLARRLLLNADGWEHESFRLPTHQAQGEHLGTWVVECGEPFTHALVSFNADVPRGAGVQAEVAVPDGDGWSPWMMIADWGEVPRERLTPTRWSGGRIMIDELIADQPLARLRVRVRGFAGSGGAAMPVLDRVDVVVSRRAPERVLDAAAGRDVRVETPFRPCEIKDDDGLASRLCSPTSLAMLLAQRGARPAYGELIGSVYDARHDLYGVWPRAIQAAYAFGVPGRLHRFGDWAEVRDHLSSVGPIAISMRAAEGEVRGMGYDASDGHIVVLTGLTALGDAVVLDPAFGTEDEARRVYPADDLSEVWLRRSRGTAYILHSEGDR